MNILSWISYFFIQFSLHIFYPHIAQQECLLYLCTTDLLETFLPCYEENLRSRDLWQKCFATAKKTRKFGNARLLLRYIRKPFCVVDRSFFFENDGILQESYGFNQGSILPNFSRVKQEPPDFSQESLQLLEELLKQHPNVELYTESSMFFSLSRFGTPALMERMMEIFPKEASEMNILHHVFQASMYNNIPMMRFLLERNPDVDLYDEDFPYMELLCRMGANKANEKGVLYFCKMAPHTDFSGVKASDLVSFFYNDLHDLVKLTVEKHPNILKMVKVYSNTNFVDRCIWDVLKPMYDPEKLQ